MHTGWKVLIVFAAICSLGTLYFVSPLGRSSSPAGLKGDDETGRSRDSSSRASRSGGAASSLALERMQKRLDELEGRVGRQEGESGDRGARPNPLAGLSPEERAKVLREKTERVRQTLEQAVEAEPVDRSRAGDAEMRFRESLGKEDYAGTTIDSIDCRSSLCRVVLTHANEEARDVFTDRMPMEGPALSDTSTYRVDDGSGEIRTEYFFDIGVHEPGTTSRLHEISSQAARDALDPQ
jgi:hypothetical protein